MVVVTTTVGHTTAIVLLINRMSVLYKSVSEKVLNQLKQNINAIVFLLLLFTKQKDNIRCSQPSSIQVLTDPTLHNLADRTGCRAYNVVWPYA